MKDQLEQIDRVKFSLSRRYCCCAWTSTRPRKPAAHRRSNDAAGSDEHRHRVYSDERSISPLRSTTEVQRTTCDRRRWLRLRRRCLRIGKIEFPAPENESRMNRTDFFGCDGEMALGGTFQRWILRVEAFPQCQRTFSDDENVFHPPTVFGNHFRLAERLRVRVREAPMKFTESYSVESHLRIHLIDRWGNRGEREHCF